MATSSVPDACASAMRELQAFLDQGYAPELRDDYEAGARQRLDAVRAHCDARRARLAGVLVERALGRLSTAEAVAALSDPAVLGDESDRLALQALTRCALLSLADPAQDPARHRAFRKRALELAVRLGDWLARAAVLTNWLFAEITERQLDEAERLRAEAGAVIESEQFPADSADALEVKARYLSHCAKLVLRRAAASAATPVSDALAQADRLYGDAVHLVRARDHLRVNLQIEWADELVDLGTARDDVPLAQIRAAVEIAHRAQGAHICDDCRAYFYSMSAGCHELAARRIYNRDRAAALEAWQAAIDDHSHAISVYEAMKHHLAADERGKLEAVRSELERATQPMQIFLSHASADKPRVRELAAALRDLGFAPWLDEDKLPAGAPLERGLLDGMNQSCAAVFLLTEQFRDRQYLETEINYALKARRDRSGFAVIALILGDGKIEVPGVLETHVYKRVHSDLEALRAILAALPICVGTVRWRDGAS